MSFCDHAYFRSTRKPVTVAIIVAVVCAVAILLLHRRDAANSDITIRATGMQWKWSYDYLQGEGEGISFFSTPRPPAVGSDERREVDHRIVVPVHKKIRIVLTAVDVIHEWYIPALGVDQPAVPSLMRDTWFRADRTGVYRGECSDRCGPDHLCLPIVIEVVGEDGYKQWVAARKRT